MLVKTDMNLFDVIKQRCLFLFEECYHDGCHRPSSRHSLLDCIRNENGKSPYCFVVVVLL